MQAFLNVGAKLNQKKPSPPDAQPVDQPWVEKYRPQTVDDVAYQDEVVAVLKKCLGTLDLPNLLFYGPPGTGKTSAILALAKQIFGRQLYADRVLELNASDERGINIVRQKIKNFAQYAASNVTADGKQCPPYKLVILDEADSMTKAAQAALRRTMEREMKTTRFCLICNYITSIIEPISSRCAKFRFKPLSKDVQNDRVMAICKAEKVDIQPEALDLLICSCEGDLRRAINALQSANSFSSASVTADDVAEICRLIPSTTIHDFLAVCRSGSYEKLQNFATTMQRSAYSVYQLISQLHDELLDDDSLDNLPKAHLMCQMAVCERHILEGADESLQLMLLGSTAMKHLRE